ncbi:MAG TPA: cytochrome b/b6 domain-containing protein [Candidatus Sulfotelmatobacter sp.]
MLSDVSDAASPRNSNPPRHAAFVRVTHWLTAICFFALLISGAEIVVSHPRFYWGETGNLTTRPMFKIPVPASRNLVPTGYGYVMPDQNGWSRYLHFQAAWAAVLTGLAYALWGLWTGHFRKNLFPAPADRTWRGFWRVVATHIRFTRPDAAEALSYNAVQRAAYLLVVFVLFPLVIWTGLALSPGFNSAFPAPVNVLGGRQSARTLHFFVSGFILLFLIVHIVMVVLAGFTSRMRAMITGTMITGTMITGAMPAGATTTGTMTPETSAQTSTGATIPESAIEEARP